MLNYKMLQNSVQEIKKCQQTLLNKNHIALACFKMSLFPTYFFFISRIEQSSTVYSMEHTVLKTALHSVEFY